MSESVSTSTFATTAGSKPGGKIILLVEARVKPEHRDTILAASKENLPLTLAEPGVQAFYQTVRHDDPNVLVFFEVFASKAAHDFHLEQNYTKEVFNAMQAGLAEPPKVTHLAELSRGEADYE